MYEWRKKMEYAEAILCMITLGLVALITVLTIKAEVKSFNKGNDDVRKSNRKDNGRDSISGDRE